MNGKELVKAAMRREPVERTPWVPFVGCHGGALLGINATEYQKSGENIVAGVKEAIRRYKPDGIPVTFDLQIEAEILGCDLVWSDENPPAVVSHPLANGKKLDELTVPKRSDGRIPVVLEATRTLRKEHPDIALYGLITGPFTLAMHLQGTDLFMKMYEDPDYVLELVEFCKDVCINMSRYLIEAGCDVIAVVDPMTSQIGPEQFNQFVTSSATSIFDFIRQQNVLGSFFVCGQAQQNIEVMCQCRPDNVSVDENIPLDYVRDVCLKHEISFGGNLQLTIVLLLGSERDVQKNTIECLDIGGTSGFILAPGCDLPYATPPKNLEAVTSLVYDPYQRDIARTLDEQGITEGLLDMSDYGQADKVIVDIITLDSEACAPCQYMVESVKKVAPQFDGIVEWREHKIKHEESVLFMTSLMVKNIPTICIDGKIVFVSRIPPKDELIAAIQKRIYEKLRYKIRTKKGSVFILGKNEQEVNQLKSSVSQAIHELGAEVNIVEIMDEKEILSFGVTKTPALVTASYKIKSEGSEPAVPIIKEWVKEVS